MWLNHRSIIQKDVTHAKLSITIIAHKLPSTGAALPGHSARWLKYKHRRRSIDRAPATFVNRKPWWKSFNRLKHTAILLFAYYILQHFFQCQRIRFTVKFAVILIMYSNKNSNRRPTDRRLQICPFYMCGAPRRRRSASQLHGHDGRIWLSNIHKV